MWSDVDRNVVIRRIPVLRRGSFVLSCLNFTKGKIVGLADYSVYVCVCVCVCVCSQLTERRITSQTFKFIKWQITT